jgi:hypothetical protein
MRQRFVLVSRETPHLSIARSAWHHSPRLIVRRNHVATGKLIGVPYIIHSFIYLTHVVICRRISEMALMIQETFESCVLLKLFPRSQIDIFVEIIQSDGSALSAAINATTLALIDAGVPLADFICACSVGMLDNQPIIG